MAEGYELKIGGRNEIAKSARETRAAATAAKKNSHRKKNRKKKELSEQNRKVMVKWLCSS